MKQILIAIGVLFILGHLYGAYEERQYQRMLEESREFDRILNSVTRGR